MQELVNQCLNLIFKDDVDEVVQAFRDTYFWYVNNNFPTQESYQYALNRFLNKISQTLEQRAYQRILIPESELTNLPFRHSMVIVNVIQKFLETSSKDDGIDFLGELIGAYALAVP